MRLPGRESACRAEGSCVTQSLTWRRHLTGGASGLGRHGEQPFDADSCEPAEKNAEILFTRESHSEEKAAVRNSPDDRPEDDDQQGAMETEGQRSQRADDRPAHRKTQADRQHTNENARRRPAAKFAQISTLFDGPADAGVLHEPQAEFVRQFIHDQK